MSSFLSGRTQRVMCGDCISDSVDVLSGVPQGSVLGPFLFLIYIDDILQHFDSTCCLYVNDCILYRKIESAHDVIMLQMICLYWNDGRRSGKCLLILISVWFFQLHKKIPIQGNVFCTIATELKMTESAKYLGVEIDCKSSFNQHIL